MQRYTRFFDTYLSEAIIKIDSYFNNIEKLCKDMEKNFKKEDSYKHTCTKLSFMLRKYKIEFIPQEFIQDEGEFTSLMGINKGGTLGDKKGSIAIYCNPNILKLYKNYRSFIKALFLVLKHEVIYRLQYLKIENKKLRKMVSDSKNPDVDSIYLNDKYELMAYAWQLVEYYRLMGLNKHSILNALRMPKENHELQNTILSAFIHANKFGVVKDKSLKLLYKYAFLYAEEN